MFTPFWYIETGVTLLLMLPSATVPSWQLRHKREEPFGCGTVIPSDCSLELL